MPSLSKPGIVNPIQQTTGVLVKKIRVDYVSLHIARLPLGSFRCRAAISCLKQYIQGLQSNADYGNKHLASVLAFERLNFREHTPQTKAETKLLQIVAIIKPQLSLQVVLITGKAIRHRITFCRPYILLIIHPPSAFAGGTSPKCRVQRR